MSPSGQHRLFLTSFLITTVHGQGTTESPRTQRWGWNSTDTWDQDRCVREEPWRADCKGLPQAAPASSRVAPEPATPPLGRESLAVGGHPDPSSRELPWGLRGIWLWQRGRGWQPPAPGSCETRFLPAEPSGRRNRQLCPATEPGQRHSLSGGPRSAAHFWV